MRAVTPRFLSRVRDGGDRVDRVYVKRPGGEWAEVDAVGYRVTAERGAVARYSGSVTLAPGADPVTPYGSLVQIKSGFAFPGELEELVHVATMRVDDVDIGPSGAASLTCLGLEKAVADAAFRTPRVIQGPSHQDAIRDLLAVVDAPVSVIATRDAPVPLVVFDTDRWKSVDGDDRSLARAIGAEVFCDAAGVFVVRDIPTVTDQPVWAVDAGESGVLVDYRRSASRAGVYNVVVAGSDNAEANILQIVEDDNPSSPTYVGGPFGEVVRQYRSPLLTNQDQARAAARSLLAESGGLQRSLTFTQVPNPALEPGDVVRVMVGDGASELHLIDQVEHSSSGAQSCQTRTTRGT